MFEKNVGRKNMKVVDRLNFSNREALPKIILNISDNYTGPGIALNTRLSIVSLIISRYYIMIIIAQTTQTHCISLRFLGVRNRSPCRGLHRRVHTFTTSKLPPYERHTHYSRKAVSRHGKPVNRITHRQLRLQSPDSIVQF